MYSDPPDNVVDLALVREALPVADYERTLFEWRLIGERLAPHDLALAVEALRDWPTAAGLVVTLRARV